MPTYSNMTSFCLGPRTAQELDSDPGPRTAQGGLPALGVRFLKAGGGK